MKVAATQKHKKGAARVSEPPVGAWGRVRHAIHVTGVIEIFDLWSKERARVANGAHGGENVVIAVRFHNVSPRPGAKTFARDLLGEMHRENHDFRVRRLAPEQARYIEAILLGQRNIEY